MGTGLRLLVTVGLLGVWTVHGATTDTNELTVAAPTESMIQRPSVLAGRADGSNPYPTNWPSSSGVSNWPTGSGASMWPSRIGTGTITATATYKWPTNPDSTNWPTGSGSWSGSGSSNWNGYDGGGGDEWANVRPWPTSWGTRPVNYKTFRIVHAALAASAFLIFFPVGGILMRVSRHPNAVWVHAVVQTLGYVVFMTASGFGVWMAKKSHSLNGYHPVIGLLLTCFVNLQLTGGLINRFFLRRPGRPSPFTLPGNIDLGRIHSWFGRFFILLGMINGGLGLRFASTLPVFQWPKGPKAAYGVIATLVFVIYLAVSIVWWEFDRPRQNTRTGSRSNATTAGDHGRHPTTAAVAPVTTTNVESNAEKGKGKILNNSPPSTAMTTNSINNDSSSFPSSRPTTSKEMSHV